MWKKIASLGVLAICGSVAAQVMNSYRQIGGTDGLGRKIATPEMAQFQNGIRGKTGVFYSLAHGIDNPDLTSGPFNIEKIIADGGLDAKLDPLNPAWRGVNGSVSLYTYEPVFGFYTSRDRWVMRKHLRLLSLAGVDFVIVDISNGEINQQDYVQVIQNLLAEVESGLSEGWNPPKVTFHTNEKSGSDVFILNDSVYKKQANKDVFFSLNPSKNSLPMIIARSAGVKSVGLDGAFEVRETHWPSDGLAANGSWPWIDYTRSIQVYNDPAGIPEMVTVSSTQHPMHLNSLYPFEGKEGNFGRGYSGGVSDHSKMEIIRGANAEESWGNALTKSVPFVILPEWNENRAAHNDPIVVDSCEWVGLFDYVQFAQIDSGVAFSINKPSVMGAFQWKANVNGASGSCPEVDLDRNGLKWVVVEIEYGSNFKGVKQPAFWFKADGAGKQDDNMIIYPSSSLSGSATKFVFNMSDSNHYYHKSKVGEWKGKLRVLRVMPSLGDSTSVGDVTIKRIELRKDPLLTNSGDKVWNFATSDTWGWTPVQGTVLSRSKDGKLKMADTVVGGDAIMTSPDNLNVDLASNPVLRTKIENDSACSDRNVFFEYTTDQNPIWASIKLTVDAYSNINTSVSGTEISEKLTGQGKLKQMRFRFPSAQRCSRFVNYVRIGSSDPQKMPALSMEFSRRHYMVDECDNEYSRSLEMTRGELSDHHYMQLANFARLQGGVEDRIRTSDSKTIVQNNDFSQWDAVNPGFKDFSGDVDARKDTGIGGISLSNDYGRNDFELAKVARDDQNVYFYIQTKEDIKDDQKGKWMQLFIDADNDAATGWLGYDYVVNRRSPTSGGKLVLEQCINNRWAWVKVGDVDYEKFGNKMHLKIPRAMLGNIPKEFAIQFKWLDNVEGKDPLDFYVHGDAAPDGRFNFEYVTSSQAQIKWKPLSIPGNYSYSSIDNSKSSGLNSPFRFLTSKYWWSSTELTLNETAWVVEAFGAVKEVGAIEVFPRKFGRTSVGFPRDFYFDYLDNDGNWHRISELDRSAFAMPAPNGGVFFELKSPVRAQAIRWTGTKHRYNQSGSKFFMQCAGISAYPPDPNRWRIPKANVAPLLTGIMSLLND